MADVIKKTNQKEVFKNQKLFKSIYRACLSADAPAGEAEMTAKIVCVDILPWISKKSYVTTLDIRIKASSYLDLYNPSAAYFYKNTNQL